MENLIIDYQTHVVQERPWLNMLIIATAIFLLVLGIKGIIKLINHIQKANYEKLINSPEYKKMQAELERRNKERSEASWKAYKERTERNMNRCKACFHFYNSSCPIDSGKRSSTDSCLHFVKK